MGCVILLVCRVSKHKEQLYKEHHTGTGGSLCISTQDRGILEANVASTGPQIMSSLLSKTSKDSSLQELKISEA